MSVTHALGVPVNCRCRMFGIRDGRLADRPAPAFDSQMRATRCVLQVSSRLTQIQEDSTRDGRPRWPLRTSGPPCRAGLHYAGVKNAVAHVTNPGSSSVASKYEERLSAHRAAGRAPAVIEAWICLAWHWTTPPPATSSQTGRGGRVALRGASRSERQTTACTALASCAFQAAACGGWGAPSLKTCGYAGLMAFLVSMMRGAAAARAS